MADTGQQSLSSRTVMEMVCDTLRELRDSEGVTPAMVRQYVRHKYGAEPKGAVSERRLRLELHKGVQEGFLVTKSGRWVLHFIIFFTQSRVCATVFCDNFLPFLQNTASASVFLFY